MSLLLQLPTMGGNLRRGITLLMPDILMANGYDMMMHLLLLWAPARCCMIRLMFFSTGSCRFDHRTVCWKWLVMWALMEDWGAYEWASWWMERVGWSRYCYRHACWDVQFAWGSFRWKVFLIITTSLVARFSGKLFRPIRASLRALESNDVARSPNLILCIRYYDNRSTQGIPRAVMVVIKMLNQWFPRFTMSVHTSLWLRLFFKVLMNQEFLYELFKMNPSGIY